MASRQSVWTDKEVVELVSHFIPAADEVWHLHSGKDEECRLFQKVAEQGHYADTDVPTRQGTYAVTADGLVLGAWNSNDARVVVHNLREALSKWEALPDSARSAKTKRPLDVSKLDRRERFYPEDGLVLRINTRDLPRENPQGEKPHLLDDWNQDFSWFTQAEARQFLPQRIAVGQTREVPRALVERLAQFHFLDNVRGQTDAFPAQAVSQAQLASKITQVRGNIVTLRFKGYTRTAQEGTWSVGKSRDKDNSTRQKRGVELAILGNAEYDQQRARFTRFECVAIGSRWGGTKYNFRFRDLGTAPFGLTLTLAGDTPAERVAPEHFWGYGWQ